MPPSRAAENPPVERRTFGLGTVQQVCPTPSFLLRITICAMHILKQRICGSLLDSLIPDRLVGVRAMHDDLGLEELGTERLALGPRYAQQLQWLQCPRNKRNRSVVRCEATA